MFRRIPFFVLLLTLLTTATLADEMPVLEVSVLEDGQILIGGEQADIDSLEDAIRALSEGYGLVLYYRENAASPEPHPIAFQVLDLVVQYDVPIALSTTADFSTVMVADGTVMSREELLAPSEPYGWPSSDWTFSEEHGRCVLRQSFAYGTDHERVNTNLIFMTEHAGGSASDASGSASTDTAADDRGTGDRAPILLISPNYIGFEVAKVIVGGYDVPIVGRPPADDGSEWLNAILESPGSERVFELIAQNEHFPLEFVSSDGDVFRFLYARHADDGFEDASEQFDHCVDGR